jgi:hypothetical protein
MIGSEILNAHSALKAPTENSRIVTVLPFGEERAHPEVGIDAAPAARGVHDAF